MTSVAKIKNRPEGLWQGRFVSIVDISPVDQSSPQNISMINYNLPKANTPGMWF